MFCKRLTEFLVNIPPPFVGFDGGDPHGGFMLFLILLLLGYGIVYIILTVLWLVSRPICWINK